MPRGDTMKVDEWRKATMLLAVIKLGSAVVAAVVEVKAVPKPATCAAYSSRECLRHGNAYMAINECRHLTC